MRIEIPARGLLVRRPWIGLILSGQKTWEIRSTAVSPEMCGPIALIESGSGLVVGTAILVRSVGPLSNNDLARSIHLHQVQDVGRISYKKPHAWVLSGASRLPEPVPYNHPSGAVIWVRLDREGVLENQAA